MFNAVKTLATVLVLGIILPGAAAAVVPPPLTEPVHISFAAEARGSVSYHYAAALRPLLIRELPEGFVIYITQRSSGVREDCCCWKTGVAIWCSPMQRWQPGLQLTALGTCPRS